MRRGLLFALLAATLAVPSGAPAIQAKKAAATRDWTRTVVATTEGFRVGNPNAPVKLVEYASLTCPHCAHFAKEGVPQLLAQFVKPGRVSFEFRNFVRDPYDLTGALLSRCAGPGNFFALTHEIFDTQRQWIERVKPQESAIAALPEGERFNRIAAVSGLNGLAAKAGVSAEKGRQCLADNEAVDRLMRNRQSALQQGLEGTPMFLVNGKKVDGHDWASLRPLLGPPAS